MKRIFIGLLLLLVYSDCVAGALVNPDGRRIVPTVIRFFRDAKLLHSTVLAGPVVKLDDDRQVLSEIGFVRSTLFFALPGLALVYLGIRARKCGSTPQLTQKENTVAHSVPRTTKKRTKKLGLKESTVARSVPQRSHIISTDFDTLEAEAVALANADRYAEAIERLLAALEIDPDAAQASFTLGFCYSRLAQSQSSPTAMQAMVDNATNAFQNALDLSDSLVDVSLSNEQDSKAAFVIGMSWVNKKNIAKAIKYLERSVAMDPNNGQARSFLAAAYSESERPADAEQTLALLSDVDPQDSSTYALQNKTNEQQEIAELPVGKQKAIYDTFSKLTRDAETHAMVEDVVGGASSSNPLDLFRMMQKATQSGREIAIAAVIAQYGITRRQLLSIERRGKEESGRK